jgi:Metallo-peptidase family M12B Reprolysin-like
MADPCTPVVLVAAAGTTDAERGSLADAAALWSAVAAVQLGVDAAVGATTIPVRFQSAPLAFLGAYEPDRQDVVVNSEIPDEPTRAIVLAHEIGHAFGMAHIAGRPSVMNASNSTVAPNALDAVALAGLWGSCSR